MNSLHAKKRSKAEDLGTMRINGMLPGVVYGASVENTSLLVTLADFTKTFKITGESTPIVLDMDGKKIDVLVHDIQIDPVTQTPVHVDFLAIDTKKAVQVAIPLEFTGIAPAVKNGIGVLVKVLHEIEVSALPNDLPHTIVVDLSGLENLDSQIQVENLIVPKGVTVITKEHEIVVAISQMKEEVEETVPVDLTKIEVEKKGKKEEEEIPAE